MMATLFSTSAAAMTLPRSTPPTPQGTTPTLRFEHHEVLLRPGETALDALLRTGLNVPFSCRGGVCHACLLRGTAGTVPPEAQFGLSPELAERGYLLACQCLPKADLSLARPEPSDMRIRCLLTELHGLGVPFVRLRFEPMSTFGYCQGDTLRWVTGADPAQHPSLTLTSDPAEGNWQLEAVLHCPQAQWPQGLQWLANAGEAAFGQEFEVWRPATVAAPPTGAECDTPATDPALWHEQGDGLTGR